MNPPTVIGRSSYLAPPIGLMQVASSLEAAYPGTRLSLVDLALLLAEGKLSTGPELLERAAEVLLSLDALTYAFSVQCFNLPIAVALARRIKRERPRSTIVFGGHHATMLADRLRQQFDFIDTVVSGPAEETLLPSAASKWVRPAFHLAPDLHRYSAVSRLPTGLVEISRGCPFNCTYCSIPGAFGRRLRHKRLNMVLDEVEVWLKAGITKIHFVDDVLTADRKYCLSLARALRPYRVQWSAMTRVDLIDGEVLCELAECGCGEILYGIDSGSASTLDRIRKRARRYPDPQQLDLWHKRAGIHPTYYFLLDLPGDTQADFTATVMAAAKLSVLDPGSCRLNMVRLVPGTDVVEGLSRDLVPNLASPYAETLLSTVGPDCEEIGDMIRAAPHIFSTYFSAGDGHNTCLNNFLAKFGADLLEQVPISIAALATSGKLHDAITSTIANRPDCASADDAIERLIQFAKVESEIAAELLKLESWRARCVSPEDVFLSRVDYPTAIHAIISGTNAYADCVDQDSRLYRVAASVH